MNGTPGMAMSSDFLEACARLPRAQWRVLESDDNHLCETIAGALTGEDR